MTTYYGSRRAGRGPGTPIAVVDGQRVSGLSIRVPRGAAITGMVRGSTGQPLPDARVEVQLVRGSTGRAQGSFLGDGTAQTDDRGIYRIHDLAPGDYVVRLATTGRTQAEMRRATGDEIAWAQQAVAQTPSAPGTAPAPLLYFNDIGADFAGGTSRPFTDTPSRARNVPSVAR